MNSSVARISNTLNLITMCHRICSRGNIFVIHTKIKPEPAGVDQGFLKWEWYLRVAELMGHAHKMLLLANWDLHGIEKLDRISSNATK